MIKDRSTNTLQLHTLNNVVATFIKQKLLEKSGC